MIEDITVTVPKRSVLLLCKGTVKIIPLEVDQWLTYSTACFKGYHANGEIARKAYGQGLRDECGRNGEIQCFEHVGRVVLSCEDSAYSLFIYITEVL